MQHHYQLYQYSLWEWFSNHLTEQKIVNIISYSIFINNIIIYNLFGSSLEPQLKNYEYFYIVYICYNFLKFKQNIVFPNQLPFQLEHLEFIEASMVVHR